jgi:hypothetical protein
MIVVVAGRMMGEYMKGWGCRGLCLGMGLGRGGGFGGGKGRGYDVGYFKWVGCFGWAGYGPVWVGFVERGS